MLLAAWYLCSAPPRQRELQHLSSGFEHPEDRVQARSEESIARFDHAPPPPRSGAFRGITEPWQQHRGARRRGFRTAAAAAADKRVQRLAADADQQAQAPPLQDETIRGYAETARALGLWMTEQEVDDDFTACDVKMLNEFFSAYRNSHSQGGTNTRQRAWPVAVAEFAIGIALVAGLFTRVAALGSLALLFTYVMSGTASVCAFYALFAIVILVMWRTSSWIGADGLIAGYRQRHPGLFTARLHLPGTRGTAGTAAAHPAA